MNVIKNINIVLFILVANISFAQSISIKEKNGKITYNSPSSVYVQFENTVGINVNDTLYIKKGRLMIPVITIKFLSRKSISGKLLNNYKMKVGDIVFALIKNEKNVTPKEKPEVDVTKENPKWKSYTPKPEIVRIINQNSKKISGRLTINSTSNFANYGTGFDYQRWRYSLKFNVNNVGESKLSLSSYFTFSYRANEWADVKSNLSKALRVYDLSLNYKFSDQTTFWGGRHLNRSISNISVVDGLQFEHAFSGFTLGAVVGFRPDFVDMSINSNLLEYGAYITKQSEVGEGIINNTFAVFQQTNNGNTDRRFLYFQHSNNIISGLNFFVSSEVDLFKKEAGINKNTLTLTSLYLATNISPSKFISFSLSYDARKDVIYYETFKSFLDSVINNETRQGFRVRTTIHPFKRFTVGSHFGYRYRKGDIKPHRNYGGFLSYSEIPILEASPTFSYNKILSSYLEGDIWGIRISKRMFDSSVDLTLGYKKSNYSFSNRSLQNSQENIEVGLSTRVFDSLFILLNYEGIFENSLSTGHIFVTLSIKF